MTTPNPAPTGAADSRLQDAAVALLAAWMGERFFRTFRPLAPSDADPGGFDMILAQRDRRIGVTVQPLWDDSAASTTGAATPGLSELVETPDGAYALWVPPGGAVPTDEPHASDFRSRLEHALNGLEPAERREFRLPVRAHFAQVEGDGAYVSVAGGLAPHWLAISDGVAGSYHLDSRELKRLPEQEAELEIMLSRLRDVAEALEPGEVTPVELHDYWLVSRIPGDAPAGLTVIGAPPTFVPDDGAVLRRAFRAGIRRTTDAVEAAAGSCEMSVLVIVAPLAHLADERVTPALRGMSPASYAAIDLIVLVTDGLVRQVLQPRALPWDGEAASRHGEQATGGSKPSVSADPVDADPSSAEASAETTPEQA